MASKMGNFGRVRVEAILTWVLKLPKRGDLFERIEEEQER